MERDIVVLYVPILFVTGVRCSRKMSVAYCQTCYEEKQLTALNVTTSQFTADKSDISCISTPDDKEDQSTTDETSSISSLKKYVNEFEIDRLEDTVDWQQIYMTKCSVHIELAYEIVFFLYCKEHRSFEMFMYRTIPH